MLGASRVEVTFFTNSLAVLGMLVSTIANGNLLVFMRFVVENPNAIGLIVSVGRWRGSILSRSCLAERG